MAGRTKVIIGAVVTYIAGAAIAYQYISKDSNENNNTNSKVPQKITIDENHRQKTYAKMAPHFDQQIGGDEIAMGLNLIRWWNIRKAKGKVLEIGCGTGRNMSYYNFSQVSKLIAIDSVKEMIDVARTKIPSSLDDPSQVQLKQMNAHDLREFADNSFDTVVDTFGLCSYQSPHKVLHELSRVLNKANPDARIILIEHGRAYYDWLNNSLNSRGQQHAHDWGCVWNLPIDQIVQEAGLEIVSMSRFHMGTTYVIEARPAPPGAPHARSLHEYHSHYQPPPRPDDPATHRHVEVHPPAELDDHAHSHGHPHPPAAPAPGPSPSSSQQHPR